MRETSIGHASGKLVLLGEHAVVYGHSAVAVGLSLGTTVTLISHTGPTTCSVADPDPLLIQALAAALPLNGLRVEITSDLPIGRGLGSSAALSVALIRAKANWKGETLSSEQVHKQAFELERIFHGNPSGMDHAIAANGGAMLYRRDTPLRKLDMPPIDAVVLDSGTMGNTATLVAKVAGQRPTVDPLLKRMGVLAEEFAENLSDIEALGEAMNECHGLLQQVGVSTPVLDELVALAKTHGALGAKLSGAGGGGVVVALTGNGADALLQTARKRGIEAFPCTLPKS